MAGVSKDMNTDCTIYRTADFIGKRWTLLILLELHKGSSEWKRYTHIKNKLPGITPKILSARLKELQAEGLVEKRVDAVKVPVKSEYSLTKSGKGFIRIIKEMKRWATNWKFKSDHCQSADCKACQL